jgi:hypothetical protein
MPGLLDLFNSPEGQLGFSLLSAAAPSMTPMNGASRLALANQTFQGFQDNALKNKLTQAQLENYNSEVENRKLAAIKDARTQARMDAFFGNGPLSAISQSSPGAYAPSLNGMGPTAPMPQNNSQAQQLADQFGIPVKALEADMLFNGGKGLADMLAKHGAPKWENVSGNLVNVNAPGFSGGLQGGVNASSSGQVTAWQPDGKGGLVVGAPKGALDTYRAYQGISEDEKAARDLQTVTPQGQNPQMTTRGALLKSPQVSGNRVTPQQQAALDSDRSSILGGELQKAQAAYKTAISQGDQSAASRAQADMASISREMGRSGPSVGMPLQSDEEKRRAETGVTNDAAENVARAKDVKTAQKFLSIAGAVDNLFDAGPTSSGAGKLVDSAAAFFGQATPGAVVSQQLSALGGWLVANVPRMEGPQSNFDVANYQLMAADVANSALPIERRRAALGSIKQMMQATVDGGGVIKPEASYGEAEKPAKILSSLPTPNASNKGQRIRDTTTGKILVSNGLQWKPE